MSRRHIEAQIATPGHSCGGRMSCLRPNQDGLGIGKCCECGKELKYDMPPSYEKVIKVACNRECAIAAGLYPPKPRRR